MMVHYFQSSMLYFCCSAFFLLLYVLILLLCNIFFVRNMYVKSYGLIPRACKIIRSLYNLFTIILTSFFEKFIVLSLLFL